MNPRIAERAEKVESFYKTKKRMPSYSEMALIFGFSSKNSAHKIGRELIEAGIISQDKQGKILPGAFFGSVRLLGRVEAGFPSPAEEELADLMNLDEYLIQNRSATFLLTVSGDSMKDAGILPKDLVIAERASEARSGDIVVAEIDGAWTLKYFKKDSRGPLLLPANSAYEPIRPKESFRIAAIVRGVVRKYH
ncbi:MAG: transcriptional repressor LexA [Patescibacteria group bacterium]